MTNIFKGKAIDLSEIQVYQEKFSDKTQKDILQIINHFVEESNTCKE